MILWLQIRLGGVDKDNTLVWWNKSGDLPFSYVIPELLASEACSVFFLGLATVVSSATALGWCFSLWEGMQAGRDCGIFSKDHKCIWEGSRHELLCERAAVSQDIMSQAAGEEEKTCQALVWMKPLGKRWSLGCLWGRSVQKRNKHKSRNGLRQTGGCVRCTWDVLPFWSNSAPHFISLTF